MKRAEIEANARRPYADAILKVTQERDRYRDALIRIAAYQHRGPVAAAQLIALAAIELRATLPCGYSTEADERAHMLADRQAELGAQFDPRG